MLKKCFKQLHNYQKYLYLKGTPRVYSNIKLNTIHLNTRLLIHTGNSMVSRYTLYMFIARSVKYNVFFKKPLVRPIKRKKAK